MVWGGKENGILDFFVSNVYVSMIFLFADVKEKLNKQVKPVAFRENLPSLPHTPETGEEEMERSSLNNKWKINRGLISVVFLAPKVSLTTKSIINLLIVFSFLFNYMSGH